ncbi:MAG: methane monooxygenase/ammonia monooxygenase subunit A [Pseudomonadota bacterium]
MADDQSAIAKRLETQIDIILITAIVFAIAGATAFVMAVTMGDWEYWVDWKDRRFWPLVPIGMLMVIPAALSSTFWVKFRLPFAFTAIVLCYSAVRWLSTYLNFHIFGGFPISFVWPSVYIPMAILVDCSLLITRSVFLTGLTGAFLWGALIYPANWPMLAAFHEPINYNGEMLTAADLLGYEYIRTSLPEYIRVVERSILRTFGDAVTPLTAVFAGFLCTVVFYLSWIIGAIVNDHRRWLKKV